ncbi:UNVERIFIED_ORG: hypothetical protein GGI63_004639 [Rhizobium esperanzae]
MNEKSERRQRVVGALDTLYGLLDRFGDDEYEWSSLREDGGAVVADLDAADEDTAASALQAAVREATEILESVRDLRETVGSAMDYLDEIEDNADLDNDNDDR